MSLESAAAESSCPAEILDGLSLSLHGITQPLTALVFILEYGASLEAPDEVRMTMATGLEQCERLTGMVRHMQKQIMDLVPRERGASTRW